MPKCEILFKNDLFFVFQNFLEYNIVSPFILQYIDQEYIPKKTHLSYEYRCGSENIRVRDVNSAMSQIRSTLFDQNF